MVSPPPISDVDPFCSSRGVGLTDFAKGKPWRPKSLVLETEEQNDEAIPDRV